MPVMDGAEFIRKVRTVRQGVPVVLCSGRLGEASKLVGSDEADCFLAKPFMPADLLRALHSVLKRPRVAGQ